MHSAEGCGFSGWPLGLPNCQIGLTPQCHKGVGVHIDVEGANEGVIASNIFVGWALVV